MVAAAAPTTAKQIIKAGHRGWRRKGTKMARREDVEANATRDELTGWLVGWLKRKLKQYVS